MKNRKLLSSLLAVALLFSVFSSSIFSQEPVKYEPKVFSRATIHDDFDDSSVLVVLDKAVGGVDKIHKPSFFGDFPIKEIVDLTPSLAKRTENDPELRKVLQDEGLNVKTPYKSDMETFRQILKITLPKNCKQNVLDVIAQLEKVDGIISAEVNSYGVPTLTPTDPEYIAGNQWALPKINTPAAWDITTGSAHVKVAVIDSGIANHDDLVLNVNRTLGRDFINGVTQPSTPDVEGHGTRVAGIIGGRGNNGIGIAGVCWQVTLVPLKVVNYTLASVVAAIDYAKDINIPIVNASFVFIGIFNPLKQAVERYNGLLVTSAGNFGLDNDNPNPTHIYPANYKRPNIISVGSTNNNDNISSFSNYGATSVHLFAPGESILSTCARRNCSPSCTSTNQYPYCYDSGTSFSAPLVAGVAALILSKYPNATPTHIKGAIMGSVDRGGLSGLCVAEGRLNARRALESMARYGIFHIRSVSTGGYLNNVSPGVNNSAVSLTTYSDIAAKRWVVQQLTFSGYHTIHSFNQISGNTGSLMRASGGNAIVQTTSNPMGLTYNAAEGTVSFDMLNASYARLTASGNNVVWAASNGTAAQKWYLEHHPLTYKQGDVNQDGVITTADRNLVQAHLNGTITLTAVQFYLADVLRDGRITQADVDFINTMIA